MREYTVTHIRFSFLSLKVSQISKCLAHKEIGMHEREIYPVDASFDDQTKRDDKIENAARLAPPDHHSDGKNPGPPPSRTASANQQQSYASLLSCRLLMKVLKMCRSEVAFSCIYLKVKTSYPLPAICLHDFSRARKKSNHLGCIKA